MAAQFGWLQRCGKVYASLKGLGSENIRKSRSSQRSKGRSVYTDHELTVLLEVLEVLLVFQPAQRRVAAVVLCHPTAFLRVQSLALYHAGLQGLASYRHQVPAHCSSALAGLNLSWPAQLWL